MYNPGKFNIPNYFSTFLTSIVAKFIARSKRGRRLPIARRNVDLLKLYSRKLFFYRLYARALSAGLHVYTHDFTRRPKAKVFLFRPARIRGDLNFNANTTSSARSTHIFAAVLSCHAAVPSPIGPSQRFPTQPFR